MTGVKTMSKPNTEAAKPRVLIKVVNGVAGFVADPGVDVELFDKDNYDAGDDFLCVPEHFRDLAEIMDVPVESDQAQKRAKSKP